MLGDGQSRNSVQRSVKEGCNTDRSTLKPTWGVVFWVQKKVKRWKAAVCQGVKVPSHDIFAEGGGFRSSRIFLPQLSDFVPLRNGFYSFRSQTD